MLKIIHLGNFSSGRRPLKQLPKPFKALPIPQNTHTELFKRSQTLETVPKKHYRRSFLDKNMPVIVTDVIWRIKMCL